MKILKIILLINFLIFDSSIVFCQANEVADLQLLAIYHEDVVLLRWIPLDYATWKSSCVGGYSLKRIHHQTTGNDTFMISPNLKPLSAEEWDIQFPNNESAQSAKDILYNVQGSGPVMNMQDIWDAHQDKESKHLFAMILAEHSFDIGEGLALGFRDQSVSEGEFYTYVLSLNENENSMSFIMIKTDSSSSSLPSVKGIKASSDEESIYIEWNDKLTESSYTTYSIERSNDSITWTICNEVPFMNLLTTQEDFDEKDLKATFKDSPPTQTQEYYYRVRGKSPFGILGPASKAIKISCAPPKMEFLLRFDGYEEVGESVLLNWNSLSTDYNAQIVGFNIYRAKTGIENPQKINNNILSSTDRTFQDDNPFIGDYYYFLEAIDVNDYRYSSLEMLVRRTDNTAPDKVENVSHELEGFNNVKLSWEASEAQDLRGYYVHVATVRNGKYSASTKEAININQYNYSITTGIEFDSLYFKVFAEDKRRNISEASNILAIERPDVFGPSAPVLGSANPMEGGTYFTCQYSASDDVVKHELRRKKKVGSVNWETVYSISESEKEQFSNNTNSEFEGAYNFVDSTDLYDEYYTYALLAIDGAGNESSSKMFNVLPFKSTVNGAVTNFNMDVITIDNPPSSSMQKKIEKLSSRYSNTSNIVGSINKYEVKLEWDAVLDYSLSYFIIYRGIGDDPISPVLHITPAKGLGLEADTDILANSGIQTFTFTDANAKKNKRYTYYLVRVEKDGRESNKSVTLSERIPNQ